MAISLPTNNPSIFVTVQDTDNIFYSTKNQVRALCVGKDMEVFCKNFFFRKLRYGWV